MRELELANSIHIGVDVVDTAKRRWTSETLLGCPKASLIVLRSRHGASMHVLKVVGTVQSVIEHCFHVARANSAAVVALVGAACM